MSFWRIGFGQQSSIDALLSGQGSASRSPGPSLLSLEGADGGRPSTPGSGSHSTCSPPVSLETLLEEDDLLQECKNHHAKLIDFLAQGNIIRKMLEYISGSAYEGLDEHEDAGWPYSPREEESKLQKRIKYPHLCAEIILCGNNAILSTLFADFEGFLIPFWSAVLDRAPRETAQQNVQLAHWSRVNCYLLSQRPIEILALARSRPQFIKQLVRHLQSPPIADFLFRIIQCEDQPHTQGIMTWLFEQDLITLLTDKLSPALAPATHLAASDFIRSIITFCAAANTQASSAEFAPSQQQQQEANTKWGMQQQQQQAPLQETRPPVWVSNCLLQHLASREICSKLLGYALDAGPSTSTERVAINDEQPTLKDQPQPIPALDEPFNITFPTELPSPDDEAKPTSTTIISSLTNSLSIYIDLIRKNNSDFTEQQLLQFMKKWEQSELETRPPGPTIVDLQAVLDLMRERLPSLHALLKNPRAKLTIETPSGRTQPLTPERFKICELLAELLHCSNMMLLNRRPMSRPTYDRGGKLEGGYESLALLEKSLNFETPLPPPSIQPSSSASSDSVSLSTESPVAATPAAASAANPVVNDNNLQSAPDQQHLKVEDYIEQLSIQADAAALQTNSQAQEPTCGEAFRIAVLDQKLLLTVMDLFFAHPWHNFLHSVTYDLLQQVLTGALTTDVSSSLCISVFKDAELTERILEAQKLSEAKIVGQQERRFGFMGHISLLAEEVIKLFSRFPELKEDERLKDHIDHVAWDQYVDTTLREIRETDLQPLGGGLSSALNDTISSTSSLSDEDDEFPGRKRLASSSAAPQPQSPQSVSKASSQFARYFVQQLSGERSSASADSEDEDVWPAASQSGSNEPAAAQSAFDDDFGDFEGPAAGSSSGSDSFMSKHRANLTTADWNSDFKSSFDDASPLENPFAGGDSDDDDFGDFHSTPQITVPSFDSDASFDFGTTQEPSFDATSPGDVSAEDGSALFGGLHSSSPEQRKTRQRSASIQSDSGASQTMRPDGLVEAHTSDGETVVVPADEIELQGQ